MQYAAGLLAAIAVLLTGCGSGQTMGAGLNTPTNPNSTVTIDGQTYYCETVTGINNGHCSPEAQLVFDTHKQVIDPYVNSGRLGVLSHYRYTIQDAAYVGIGSCAYYMRGQGVEAFITFLRKEPTYKDVPDEDIKLAATEAQKMLCPADAGQKA